MADLKGLRCGWLSITAAAAVATAAGPASGPAGKDATEYKVDAVKARFAVPKAWEKRELQGPPGLFVFNPAPSKKPVRVSLLQQVQISLDTPTDTQKTLGDAVADLKAALLKRTPKLKFTKDAAATYAGRPVWTLQWTQSIALKTPDGKSAGSFDSDRVTFIWLEHATLCQITLQADSRMMPSLVQRAEVVAKSVGWTEVP